MTETIRARPGRRPLRYAVAGIAVNAVAYLVFVALVGPLGLAAPLATALVYLLAFGLGYVVHRAWTFESLAAQRHDLPRYLAAHGAGFFVSVAAMAVLERAIPPELAQLLVIGIAAGTIYAVLSLSGFGRKGRS